ncbi:gfo/Idh/MocA family oxidoreductase [Sphingobacterium sp. DK4209]|uniref:Gfo/Idh/MocA family oxidoreductase n=2 Tax=Sphingobacterium zhuxiongii TaxID=2662364 RepID=A0A5Q0QFT8_9SPHI|nr:gfo/Idh/MocA family oxidoreductase [Sphingobacterium sp. DK4209]QGA28214.1 gfo/Idh/MocA family oxidoreductase [Sphingobacterium sp. dk4302]
MPKNSYPIYMIGAGGIIEDAHLPAYRKANWPIAGIYDIDTNKAFKLKEKFDINTCYDSLSALVSEAPKHAIFDIAVPASQLLAIIAQLPDGAYIMMQKPMGETLTEAKKIRDLVVAKKMIASVNFQMKFIPSLLAAKKMVDQGIIGELHDIEIRMNIYHPWELWNFLFGLPRMEMLYHSIHYMDIIKHFLGMPSAVYAKTFQHPKQMQLSSTRSIILFDYQQAIRAFVNTNHGHDYGLKYQDSFIKLEGTKGAIKAVIGKNINFPQGEPDSFEYYLTDHPSKGWISKEVAGHWYPDAFIATMADLMCAIEDPTAIHDTSIHKAFDTMRLVEAAYLSNDTGGTAIPDESAF